MLKKTLNYLIFSIFASGISFLITVYLARTISQESMGIIGLFMAVLFISPQLISFASTGLISINKVKLKKEEFIDFSKTYFSFGLINFLFIFIFSCIFSLFFKEVWEIFFLLPIISFFMFIISFHQAELVQEGKAKNYGVYNTLNVLFTAFFTVLFISFFNLDWDGRLWAMMIGYFITIVLMYKNTFTTLSYFKITLCKVDFKGYIKFGLPLFAGLGAGWILNQADNYIILNFFTLKDVGIYAVAYSIGTIVNSINQATINAIIPILYNALEKKEGYKIVKKLNIYYSITIVSISLFIGITSYWYMPIIFGEAYASSANIVFFIALAFAFNGIYRTTSGVIAFYKQNVLQMKLLYISALINLILSIILIPTFGLVSPAIGTLIAYIFLASASYIYGWKILQKEENII